MTFSEVKVGDNISLSTKDSVAIAIEGMVIAKATYEVAKSMNTDLAAKHAAMQAALGGTGNFKDITDNLFLIIDTGGTRPKVVAEDWIYGSIIQTDSVSSHRIKLLNCDKQRTQEAINILRANNFSCVLDD
jgi:hypothetical protein